jgi:large subunit ribosomal protein L10
MKSKSQKQIELGEAKQLLENSEGLIFADFTKVTAEDLRKFRRELAKVGGTFLVIKKRLLALLFKEKGIDVDLKQYKTSIGTVFAENGLEGAAAPAFQFFKGLELPEGAPKDMWIKHLIGGYDVKAMMPVDAAQVIYIGTLPPREVLLAQLLGMLAAPIRSFLYVLDQKAKQTSTE